MFVNDVHGVFRFCRFHIYADDFQFYHSCLSGATDQLAREVNADFASFAAWSKCNGLLLNVRKTQALFVSRPSIIAAHFPGGHGG
jgi:hypothetical protein